MKRCKKVTSLLLIAALILSLGMSSIALADTEKGSITIDNAVNGQTYTIYKILDLNGFDSSIQSYLYTASEQWEDFIESEAINGVYVNVDDNGYVTAVDGADFAKFAKLAKEYAKENSITHDGQKTADGTTVEFTNLDLGYYLVDTSLGALCSLTTTKPTVTVKEKNEESSLNKTVKEDSTGEYGKTNDADLNQKVEYKTVITVKAGAENYVLHDKMSAGLTLDKNSIKVAGNSISVDETDGYVIKDSNGKVIAKVEFDVSHDGQSGNCTFDITFEQEYLDTLNVNDTIEVTYEATLNSNAVIGLDEDGNGNTNDTALEYGDNNSTQWNRTTTYTYDMQIFKYTPDSSEGTKTPLKDAKFVLLNSTKDKVAIIENGKLTGWSTAIPAEDASNPDKWPNNTVLTTDTTGYISIAGLDKDTYYLREIVAPAGFNPLKKDVKVEIKGVYQDENDSNKLKYDTTIAEVENNSGTELPSTGGIGTTIFYVVGSVLVLGAGVLLVTRKRMSTK